MPACHDIAMGPGDWTDGQRQAAQATGGHASGQDGQRPTTSPRDHGGGKSNQDPPEDKPSRSDERRRDHGGGKSNQDPPEDKPSRSDERRPPKSLEDQACPLTVKRPPLQRAEPHAPPPGPTEPRTHNPVRTKPWNGSPQYQPNDQRINRVPPAAPIQKKSRGPRPYMPSHTGFQRASPTHRESYPWPGITSQTESCQVRNTLNRGAHQSPIPPTPDPGKTYQPLPPSPQQAPAGPKTK
ncbi:hypothetical protein QE152_g1200 [Popillia japonica]|uniref:Uncharacterized protein n=1 Tax=Popillia japonica TaxID=7064 RepID=A0AAW1N3I3_POPJA